MISNRLAGMFGGLLGKLSAAFRAERMDYVPPINPPSVRAPAMIRPNRPIERAPSPRWLAQWCADHVGRGFCRPMFEPLPAPYFWKRDAAGPTWRIYRGAE